MKTPYETAEDRAFWATAVAQRNMFDIADLWRPKFRIGRKTETVTFGSCFAQHFSRALVKNGFAWADKEPGPPGLTEADAARFNYGVFSARTGNIYTTSLLLQWVRWALGQATPPDIAWDGPDGRVIDPFRPRIEPGGFADRDEMRRSRAAAIAAFARCIREPSLFVFTLGLTESWWEGREQAFEYPMCPGTVAGDFDPEAHVFVNQDYTEVVTHLTEAIALMREVNPGLRILLTVSPVPLTATNSGNHVLVATTESKAILRAAAAAVARDRDDVDYFPSYEIISAGPYRGVFFEPNLRSVNPRGVRHVMASFFGALPRRDRPKPEGEARAARSGKTRGSRDAARDADVVCEEELLNAVKAGKRGGAGS